jgi:hypothetical protein
VRALLGNTCALQPNGCSRILIYLSPTGSGTRYGPGALPHTGMGSGAVGHVGGPGALLSREMGSGAVGHVVAPEPSHEGRRGLEPWDAWQHQSPPTQGGWVQCRGTHDSALLHALLLALAWRLYAGVPGLQGTDSGPRTHLRRGGKPAGGAKIFFPRAVLLEPVATSADAAVVWFCK